MASNMMIETSGFSYSTLNQAPWFYQALKKANTIQNDYVRVLSNVVKDTRVKKLVMADQTVSQVDNRDCDWTPVDRFEMDEALFSVRDFKINEQQCLEELDNVYSEMLFSSIGANTDKWPNVGSPESLEDVIMLHLQDSLALDIERLIWGGASNSVAGIHDGIVDKALASTDTIKVANPVTIDQTNVLSEISRVYQLIPERVLQDESYDPERAKVRIFCSSDVMRALKMALSTAPTQYLVQLPAFTIDGGVIRYLGVEIVSVGLPANTLIAASRDNLIFLTDLLSDTQEIRVAMGKELMNENIWYAKGAYRANAGFIFDDEIVIYSL